MENKRIYLSSPTMHGEELDYVKTAYDTNWMSTVGENLDAIEEIAAKRIGVGYAVALSNGTAALHLAIRLAGIRLYGKPRAFEGALRDRRVFCSDMTFDATCNPVAYEGGECVFIDAEYRTWNLDPDALERAFAAHPDVRIVIMAHLYGAPAQIDRIKEICAAHDAVLIEDAAESLGATYHGRETGSFGDLNVISFNGNKIITGSAGGMLVTDDEEAAHLVRKWSTQARDDAPWYQHTELGYNYRMSNVIAGVIRGQFPHLDEHIAQKKAIYARYREGLKDLPLSMNPVPEKDAASNYWLSCILIDPEGMCKEERTDCATTYTTEAGKSCPGQIMEVLSAHHIESRPIWKPMHLQPLYASHPFVTADAAYESGTAAGASGVDTDIFARGLCLPSDNKMTTEETDRVIDLIHTCFS